MIFVNKLKKILLFVLACVAIFGLVACTPKPSAKTGDSAVALDSDSYNEGIEQDSVVYDDPALLDDESMVSSEDEDNLSEYHEKTTFSESALKATVEDDLKNLNSWKRYEYALMAMEDGEWQAARKSLVKSKLMLDEERKNDDSDRFLAYYEDLKLKIGAAFVEVMPNLDDESGQDSKESAEAKAEEESSTLEDMPEEQTATVAEKDSITKMVEKERVASDTSEFTLPMVYNDRVTQEIYYMSHSAKNFMAGSLNRMTAFDSMIYAKLEEMKMPRDLIYLSLVESGFKVKAYSRAKASGLWQFIPETGRRYGLDVDRWVDMRRDPARATDAGLRYLKDLYNEFGDWLIAMAAYNCGEGRVIKLIREIKNSNPERNFREEPVSYWELRLPSETMKYVPRILASMYVGHHHDKYGITVKRERWLPPYDTVVVNQSISLSEIARAINVSESDLRELNPELLLGSTPPNRRHSLRLPKGMQDAFAARSGDMRRNDFDNVIKHKVYRGETIEDIADAFDILVTDLLEVNKLKDGKLNEGKTLLIPVKGNGSTMMASRYVVKQGDDLNSIASERRTSAKNIRIWNNVAPTSNVSAGDTIIVSRPEMTDRKSVSTSGRRTYVVKNSDTYRKISEQFKVSIRELLLANQGYTRRLRVGDTLVIPDNVAKKDVQPAVLKSAYSDGSGSSSRSSGGSSYSKSSSGSSSKSSYSGSSNKSSYSGSSGKSSSGNSSSKNSGSSSKPVADQHCSKDFSGLKNPPKLQSGEKQLCAYTIENGDNLSYIAQRYGTSVNRLMDLNGLKNPNDIQIGKKIFVVGEWRALTNRNDGKNDKPVAQSKNSSSNSKSSSSSGKSSSKSSGNTSKCKGKSSSDFSGMGPKPKLNPGENLCAYTIENGDNMSYLALRFGTSVNRIMELNGFKTPNALQIGKKIYVVGEWRDIIQRKDRVEIYTVKGKESLYDIAKQYKVKVEDLRAWNNLGDAKKVDKGTQLKIKVSK